MSTVIDLTCELIRRKSVTPDDGGIIALLIARLEPLGFKYSVFEKEGVTNLWATHGAGSPHFCLAGHCDVVPEGSGWDTDPFVPTVKDGKIYGRGAADMKGSLAALIVSAEEYVSQNPGHAGTLSLLVTSDEEGLGIWGTPYVLSQIKDKIDFALVGEPTSEIQFSDMIKVGRRGSLSCKIVAQGVQGHVAYPHLAENPIHALVPFLNELITTKWDNGDEYFGPTTLQISNIHSGTGAGNVIPGTATVDFNIRYSPMQSAEGLKEKIVDRAVSWGVKAEFSWIDSARPFITDNPALVQAVKTALGTKNPVLGTGGGTSDARCFAALGIPVVEFGPLNTTIHAANECVGINELEMLTGIYYSVISQLLG